MAVIHSLQKLKAMKIVKKDLDLLVKTVELNIKGLNNYKHYKPINRILEVLQEEEKVLKFHLDKVNEILKQKGMVDEKGN